MTDDLDTHDKLIKAFQEYFKWQNRFEHKGSDQAGVKARIALLEIKKLSMLRRQEIHNKRLERRKTRNTKPGRPRNITKETYK
jgi:uncharacterized protein YggL (DUF469 family)